MLSDKVSAVRQTVDYDEIMTDADDFREVSMLIILERVEFLTPRAFFPEASGMITCVIAIVVVIVLPIVHALKPIASVPISFFTVGCHMPWGRIIPHKRT
jgi:hypothetical protein